PWAAQARMRWVVSIARRQPFPAGRSSMCGDPYIPPNCLLRQVADPTLVGVAIPQHAVLDVQAVQGRVVRLVEHDLGDDGAVRHLQLVDFRFVAADAPDVIAIERDAMGAYGGR